VESVNTSSTSQWSPRRRRRFFLAVAILLAVGVYSVVRLTGSGSSEPETGLVEVYDLIASGDVVSAEVNDNTRTVTVETEDGSTVSANYPQLGGGDLVLELRDAGVTDTTVSDLAKPSAARSLLTAMLPIFLIGGLLFFFMRKATGGALNFAGSVETASVPDVSFDDVIGAPEAVTDLTEVVAVLNDPDRYTSLGARVPKGVMLVGPPGVGKTLLAKAVAAEAGCAFFAVAGSDFVEMFAGVGARRVRDLFSKARSQPKAVVFIDEIDAVGRARTSGPSNGGTEERESTLNALLTEMDGFAAGNIVVIAATNRPELLDSALTRAGRFDREVAIPLPDRAGRAALFEFYLRDADLDASFDVSDVSNVLARRTSGASGADVSNVVNEAKLIALAGGNSSLTAEVVAAAVEQVTMGRERRSSVMSEFELEVVAYHEAGHAVTAMVQGATSDPMSVSIVPRGQAGGVTWLDPGDNEHFRTRSQMIADLVVAMGGRAAETIYLAGDYTQGAASDIQMATQAATRMVCVYGMSDLGIISIDPDRLMGDDAVIVRKAVQDLIEAAAEEARRLCVENLSLLQLIAEALLADETVSRSELRELQARADQPVDPSSSPAGTGRGPGA
jgi:cell division protease FtsH